nr:hypothetical protein CFP56_32843 [Quercus suber]
MGHTSKDLLHLEHKNPSTSPLESTLLVCRMDIAPLPQKAIPDGNPITGPVPKSQDILGLSVIMWGTHDKLSDEC